MWHTDESIDRRRRRELAGAARAGSWARARARNQQRAFVLSNWRVFAGFTGAGLVLALAVAWMMPNSFLSGFAVGAALVLIPGGVWVVTLQATGTASSMMGDDAEQWTAAELRRLSRGGWRLVNHVALSESDVDHVLLGPGGAFAFETKWSGSWESEYGRRRLLDAVGQVKASARRLKLWHPFKTLGIEPHPVVVLWGRGLANWSEEDRVRTIEGVSVVSGAALNEWTRSLGDDVLSDSQVASGWSALEKHIARRDPVEKMQNPLQPSVADLVVRLSLAVGVGAFGVLTVGQLQRRTGSAVLTFVLACALAAAGGLLVRFATWRWAAWSWSLGVGLTAIALLVATLMS